MEMAELMASIADVWGLRGDYIAIAVKKGYTASESIKYYRNMHLRHKAGKPIKDIPGADPLATTEEIDALVDKVMKDEGKAVSHKHMKKFLLEKQAARIASRGTIGKVTITTEVVGCAAPRSAVAAGQRSRGAPSQVLTPSTGAPPHPIQVNKYMHLATRDRGESTANTSGNLKPKTEARDTAERSVIYCFSHTVAAAATSFVPGDSSKQPGPVTELQRRCIEAAGIDLVPLPPHRKINIDDTQVIVCGGEASSDPTDEYIQIIPGGHSETGARSNYRDPAEYKDSKPQHVRVTKTATTTGAGATGPTFVHVSAAAGEVLPDPDGDGDENIVLLEIEGLAPTAHVNPLVATSSGIKGYLMFSGKGSKDRGESATAAAARIHHEVAVKPMLTAIRQMEGIVHGTAPTAQDQFLIKKDGCGAPLLEETREDRLEDDEEWGVNRRKGGPNRSGVEQEDDVGTMFPTEKRVAPRMKPEGLEEEARYARVLEAITTCERLKYPLPKARVVAAYVAVQPRLEAKAYSQEAVVRSWELTGELDKETHTTIDAEVMLNLNRGPMKKNWVDIFWANFDWLYNTAMEKGYVPEECWKKLVEQGVPPDTNAKGEVVWREAGITNEGSMRHTSINNASMRKWRLRVKQKKKEAEERRAAKAVEELVAAYNGNDAAEAALVGAVRMRKKAGPGAAVAIANDAELADFEKLLAGQLQHFIWARSWEGERPRGHKWPNKGSADKAATEACLVAEAYAVRASPVVLKRPAATAALIPSTPPCPPIPAPQVVVPAGGDPVVGRQRSASDLLGDDQWCNTVDEALTFSSATAAHLADVDRADFATQVVLVRLNEHIKTRVSEEHKRGHFCWTFARENLARGVAILELGGMLVRDVAAADRSLGCLLRPACTDVHLSTDTMPHVQGSYLHSDSMQAVWVRSGKVVGRGVSARMLEHRKGAELKTAAHKNSRFYATYPMDAAKSKDGRVFGDLQSYIGVGWDPDTPGALDKILDTKTGVLVWSPFTLSKLTRAKLGHSGGTYDLEEKQAILAGYFFELLLDLLIDPDHNVSESAGFESFIGVCRAT